MPERICARCGEPTPIEGFALDATKANGHKSLCKPCDNAKSRDYYRTRKHAHCAWCKQPSAGDRFCSMLCQDSHAWERRGPPITIRTCAGCDEAYATITRPGLVAGAYCSADCRLRARRDRDNARDSSPERKAYQRRAHQRRTAPQRQQGLLAAAASAAAFKVTPLPLLLTRKTKPRPKQAPPAFVGHHCPGCGTVFIATKGDRGKYCTKACANRTARRAYKDKRRAQLAAVPSEVISRLKLYERDGWRCRICKRPVKRDQQVPHPLAPTLDHIVPVALGGADTYANAQTVHFRCNSRKGARVQQTSFGWTPNASDLQ